MTQPRCEHYHHQTYEQNGHVLTKPHAAHHSLLTVFTSTRLTNTHTYIHTLYRHARWGGRGDDADCVASHNYRSKRPNHACVAAASQNPERQSAWWLPFNTGEDGLVLFQKTLGCIEKVTCFCILVIVYLSLTHVPYCHCICTRD